MRAKGTGTLSNATGEWVLRLGAKREIRIPLPGIALDNDTLAHQRADVIAARFKMTGRVPVPSARDELVTEWFDRYFVWRTARGIKRVKVLKGQFYKWIVPMVESIPMQSVDKSLCKLISLRLDQSVERGELAWKTARNVWTIWSKGLRDATSCKDESLCILDANPCAGVAAPEKGQKKAKQFLYPDELLQLLSCEAVPLWRRWLYAFAVYSYMRAGEIVALEWDDVDPKRGTLSVHAAVDRSVAKLLQVAGETKTASERRFNAEAPVCGLLQLMYAARTGDRVFAKVPAMHGKDSLPNTFRADLLKAEVTRGALHKGTPTRKRICFHDLRATACTWAAIRGDAPFAIMERSGHETLEVLMEYVRLGQSLREGFGEVFPELPTALVGTFSGVDSSAQHLPHLPKNTPQNSIKQRPRQDSDLVVNNGELQGKQARSSEFGRSHLPSGHNPSGPEADDSLLVALTHARKLAAEQENWPLVEALSEQLRRLAPKPVLSIVRKPVRP